MMGKEDLGLSLSLTFPHNHHLNLTPSSSPSGFPLQKHSWIDVVSPPPDLNSGYFRDTEARAFLRGIDVNRLPSTADGEEETGVSSPNSTISSMSRKRSERQSNGGINDDEDGDTSRKKLRLSKDQSAILEESFKEHNTLNPKQKLALAKQLGLRPRQVEVWFQNRRARTKLKQTEVDCEFLKRCCENLTEKNRRLQKEVVELRALKLSPQLYMQMAPPTTLTMCPSCARMSVPPNASPTVDPRSQHQTKIYNRPIPMNPLAHGPFEALRPRS